MSILRLASWLILTIVWVDVAQAFNALIYTETGEYRHEVIDAACDALNATAQGRGNWTLTRTDESRVFFTAESLASFDVVVFLMTSGGDAGPSTSIGGDQGILTDSEKATFEGYIKNGGGFVGVHAAVGTYQTDWPWYHRLVGATLNGHPDPTQATVRVEDHSHESMRHLPDRWTITDEWMNFEFARESPVRQSLHVLATVDESTYEGGTHGGDHPIVWCHHFDGGRSWYTGLGHTASMWQDADFLKHVMDGLEWAAGIGVGDANAAHDSHYTKTTVYRPKQPMAGAVTPDPTDERFFFVERSSGNVLVYRPSTGVTNLVQSIPVFSRFEDGLLGIAFDPDFVSNQFVYVYYSPLESNENRIARFKMDGDTFSLHREVVILSIPVQRNSCCHSGGHLKFGPDGNLWLAVGDNTNPFSSDGFTPIDERINRSYFDAQRSASNTNDLRGKILRIKVAIDGTYTCPQDNLFSQDDKHRCEIYTMGNRNPFRMAISPFDPSTIYWGEIGPDASVDNVERGPAGHEEVNKASSAGNYGWPYCLADNIAYKDYDFATGQSGEIFNCNEPKNLSPNNDGAIDLPPARPSFVWYSEEGYQSNPEAVPDGSGGAAVMVPYLHKHDPARFGECALPEYYDNSLFFIEWSQNRLVQYIMDSSGNLLHAIPLWSSIQFSKPLDIVKGNDGSIYLVEYGDWSGTQNAKISRMCYNPQGVDCVATASPSSGFAPLNVQFDALKDGMLFAYEWDFNGDRQVDSDLKTPQYTYTSPGNKVATVRVYDPADRSTESFCSVSVHVSEKSDFEIINLSPLNGGIIDWDAKIVHQVAVKNGEDSPMISDSDCPGVILDSYLGHEKHTHGIDQISGTCMATFTTLTADGHDDYNDWLFWFLSATYTDATNLQTQESLQLHPRMRQAEKFSAASKQECEDNDQLARFEAVWFCTEATGDVGGGLSVGWIRDQTWLRYDTYNPHNTESVTFRVASPYEGEEVGIIQARLDDPISGRLIASASIPGTGGWQNWVDVTTPLMEPNQIFELELENLATVSAITLDSTGSSNEYPRGYQVYVAGDDRIFGSPIQPVHVVEPNTDTSPVQQIVLDASPSGVRHIRIMQTGYHASYGWSIHEATVFNEKSEKITIKAASASRESQGCLPSYAIDNNTDTRWCTDEPQRGGPYDIYLVFEKGSNTTEPNTMFNLNWFRFDGGQGVSRTGLSNTLGKRSCGYYPC